MAEMVAVCISENKGVRKKPGSIRPRDLIIRLMMLNHFR